MSPEQVKEVRERQRKIALELRKQGAHTQEEVAKIVGVPQQTISFWEDKDTSNTSTGNISNLPDLRISIPKGEYEKIYKRVKSGWRRIGRMAGSLCRLIWIQR
jgi:DNA-binding XRE family transcriptional regulator